MSPLSSPPVPARVVVVERSASPLARAAVAHVLFVSGVAELPRDDNTVKALNVPILFKPFTMDALREAVARVLATI